MGERKERRAIARVPLSGKQTVRTHEGVEAHLLDLSLCGARVEHFGILRPGSYCFVQLPTDLGSLRLSAQILWCTILGAEWRPDGERHLRSHSGLCFPKVPEPERRVLAELLHRLSAGGPPLRESHPPSASPSLTESRLICVPAWDAALLPGATGGKNGRQPRDGHGSTA
jgi:hypothetical protein